MNKSQNFGLSPKVISLINKCFSHYPEVTKAIIYGSRAKGNFRNGSDIDLALIGKELTLKKRFAIETELDDLLLPYKIDLSLKKEISNQELLDHIERIGCTFYSR